MKIYLLTIIEGNEDSSQCGVPGEIEKFVGISKEDLLYQLSKSRLDMAERIKQMILKDNMSKDYYRRTDCGYSTIAEISIINIKGTNVQFIEYTGK